MGMAVHGTMLQQSAGQLAFQFVATETRPWAANPCPQSGGLIKSLAGTCEKPRVSRTYESRRDKLLVPTDDRHRIAERRWFDETYIQSMAVTGADWDLVDEEVQLLGEMFGDEHIPVLNNNFVAAQLALLGAL